MNKNEFLTELRNRLKGLPKQDIEDRISFYSEAIDDRMDEGKSEIEAVNDMGDIDDIINEIANDTSLMKLVKEKVKPNRSIRAWEIILLILGFPLWFPLILVAFILCLVAYLLIWVLDLVVYAVELGLAASALASIIAFFIFLYTGEFNMLPLGASIMSIGGAMLLCFGCIGITKVTLKLSKAIFTGIKKSFIKKGRDE